MDLTISHVIIMFCTIAFVIGGGIYSARSVKSAEGYSLGGRNSGAALVAGSIAGTAIGGGATVGTAQMAYTLGLSAWWFTLGSGIGFIIMGLFYAGKLRATGLETIPQYLKRNYGERVATAAGIISSFGILFGIVASCLPGIQLIVSFLGVSYNQATVILSLLVAIYVFLGGMKSAGIGGILKLAVIMPSLTLAGGSAALEIYSLPDFAQVLPVAQWFNMFNNGIGSGLTNLVTVIVGVICTQTYIQCIFSATNPRVASIGAFAAAMIVIPAGLPSVAIGMYMHTINPEAIPILVLPTFLVEHQPTWLAGIALGGLIISLISSIGGLSLGIGTMLARDVVAKILPLGKGNRMLWGIRFVVLGVIGVACTISILNLDSQVLFWNFLSMALRGCGIFLLFTFAIFYPRSISKKWAFAAIVLSTLIPISLNLFIELPISPLFLGLLISSFLLLIGYEKRWRPLK